MNRLELKSPNEGSILTFTIINKFENETSFNVRIETPFFSGTAPVSTFMTAPLAEWFKEMACEWKGWKGERTWSDLESRVLLSATADSTGHIKIRVTLAGQDHDSELQVNIMFEAGQLEGMARDVALLFS